MFEKLSHSSSRALSTALSLAGLAGLASLAACVHGGAPRSGAVKAPHSLPAPTPRLVILAPGTPPGIAPALRRHAPPRMPLRPTSLDAYLASLPEPRPTATTQAIADARSRAQRELDAGKLAFRSLQLQGALAALGRSRAALGPKARQPRDFATLAEIALMRGRCLLALRRNKEAGREIAWALRLRGKRPFQPGSLSPEVERFVAATRQNLDSQTPGTLSVDSRPHGAEVFVDGRRRGKTPLTVQLGAGLHHLRVQHAGHQGRGALQQVSPGAVAKAQLFLPPLSLDALLRQLRQRRHRGERLSRQDVARLVEERHPDALWLSHHETKSGSRATLSSLPRAPRAISASCQGTAEPLARCLGAKLAPPSASAPSAAATASVPFYKRWWFWTIVGAAAAAGGATALAVGLHDPGTDLAITSQR